MSLARLKKKHSFCVTLGVVALIFALISPRADRISTFIQQLLVSHELNEKINYDSHNEKHTHTHTHSDGTTHSHPHDLNQCHQLGGDTLGHLHLNDEIAYSSSWIGIGPSSQTSNYIPNAYFTAILRPPILA